MTFLELYSKMYDDIQYIERRLDENVRSDLEALNEPALHLLKAGGKRIRPIFVLLAGRFGAYDL